MVKFTINNKGLKTQLAKLGGVPGSKGTAPGASAVIIVADSLEGITLKRITPDGSAIVTFPADVIEEGSIALSYVALMKLSGQFGDEDIRFSEGPTSIKAICGAGSSTLAKWIGEFPKEHPALKSPKALSFPSCDLLRWIGVASPAMSSDEARANICGICIRSHPGNRLVIFGTDGRRMHVIDAGPFEGMVFEGIADSGASTGKDVGIMISADCIEIVKKSLSEDKGTARISIARNGISLEVEGATLRLPMMVEAPPSIVAMANMGDPDISFSVHRTDMIAVIQRASSLAYGPSNIIGMTLLENSIRIEADDRAGATYNEELKSSTSAKDCGMAFNAAYIKTMLGNAVGETVEIGYYRDYSAFFIREKDRTLMLCLIQDESYPRA